jgi:NADH dehydrogenase, FAD-containing subunit
MGSECRHGPAASAQRPARFARSSALREKHCRDDTRPSETTFRFATLGQLATIGHHAGVAEILGLRLSGFVAWWLWRTIYLAKLLTWQKKLRVALRWTLEFAFPRDFTQQVTLHGVEQVTQRLAYVRQHPVIPRPVASDSTSALPSAS